MPNTPLPDPPMLLLLLACTGTTPKDPTVPGTTDSVTTDTVRDSGGDSAGDSAGDSVGDSTDPTDSDTACTLHPDADGDGHGDGTQVSCDPGAVADGSDCDDADPTVYPGAPELCDGRDNRCAAWDPSREEGVVTRFPTTGLPEDHTKPWAVGYARVPAEITLSDGTYAICPGTWYVNLVAPEPVSLVGVYGQLVTTLDGVADRVVLAQSDLVMSGLRVTFGGGDAGDGGGVLHLAGTLSLTDLTIDNASAVAGGAVAIEHDPHDPGEALLRDVVLTDNYAASGGALYADLPAALRLEGVRFVRNISTGAGGGAVVEEAANLVLDDVAFEDNVAAGDGGGLRADVGWPLSLTDVSFTGNRADGEGGGAWLGDPDLAALDTVRFVDNTAGGAGGGLAAYVDSLRTVDLSASGNTAAGDGGGVWIVANGADLERVDLSGNTAGGVGGGGGGLLSSAFTLQTGTVSDNRAVSGGGLYLSGSGDPSVTAAFTDTTITTNEADDGAGLFVETGTCTLDTVEVTSNLATGDGGGLWAAADVAASVGVQVSGNSATTGGGLYQSAGVYTCTGATGVDDGFRTNTAVQGGGAALGEAEGVGFVGDLCDFGVDATDNVASDFAADVLLIQSDTAWDYVDDALFTCDGTSCG